MRYNDTSDKTAVLDEVLPRYKAAWAAKNGLQGENGLFRRWYFKRQDQLLEATDIHHTAW
jgi:hypothetical protein